MTDQDVLDSCSRILRAILSDDSIVLTMDTTRDDVTNWDSFAYVNFIAVVEIELHVKFRVAEVESFENVGAIVRRIKALLSSQYKQS
jgi:acyl carrier protein